MRALSNLLFSSAVLSTLLVPAVGLATQPHSWCNTGAALIKNDSGPDPDSNKIIDAVCGMPGFETCCTGSVSNPRWGVPRWDLSCVQRAANYAWTHVTPPSDYCGHYAWAQGPITKTNSGGTVLYDYKQYYPRDFNLFVLSGNVTSLRDVEGPVAAKGIVGINYFHLNRVGSASTTARSMGPCCTRPPPTATRTGR
jgi:hypothetical protein